MDESFKSIYIREISDQCMLAICAIQATNIAWEALKKEDNTESPERSHMMQFEIFRNLHSILTHASNISKVFWPSMPEKLDKESELDFENRLMRKWPNKYDRLLRAKAMRSLYEISESHLLKDRTLRDHLEHYDERLDAWRQHSKGKNIIHNNIGPKDMMKRMVRGIEDSDMLRNYDPQTKTFHFRNEDFDIQKIADAIKEIFIKTKIIEKRFNY